MLKIRKDMEFLCKPYRPMHWQGIISIVITGLFPESSLSTRPFPLLVFPFSTLVPGQSTIPNTLEYLYPPNDRKYSGWTWEELSFDQGFQESQRLSWPKQVAELEIRAQESKIPHLHPTSWGKATGTEARWSVGGLLRRQLFLENRLNSQSCLCPEQVLHRPRRAEAKTANRGKKKDML